MSKLKKQYQQAMSDLRDALAGDDEHLSRLNDVHRFSGELRRSNSQLKLTVDSLESSVSSMRKHKHDADALERRVTETIANSDQLERKCKKLNQSLGKLQCEVDELRPLAREATRYSDTSSFVLLKAKCLECSLHFMLCTEHRDEHSASSLYCPECGQHAGGFMVWEERAKGWIFQHVPGKANPVEFGGRQRLTAPPRPTTAHANEELPPTEAVGHVIPDGSHKHHSIAQDRTEQQ